MARVSCNTYKLTKHAKLVQMFKVHLDVVNVNSMKINKVLKQVEIAKMGPPRNVKMSRSYERQRF